MLLPLLSSLGVRYTLRAFRHFCELLWPSGFQCGGLDRRLVALCLPVLLLGIDRGIGLWYIVSGGDGLRLTRLMSVTAGNTVLSASSTGQGRVLFYARMRLVRFCTVSVLFFQKAVSVLVGSVIIHHRKRVKSFYRERRVFPIVLYDGIHAVAVVHHEINWGLSFIRSPSGDVIFSEASVKVHTSDRNKAVLRVNTGQHRAKAVELIPSCGNSLGNHTFRATLRRTSCFVGEYRDNISVVVHGKACAAIVSDVDLCPIFCKLFHGFCINCPAVSLICCLRRVQCRTKSSRVRRTVMQFYDNTAASARPRSTANLVRVFLA